MYWESKSETFRKPLLEYQDSTEVTAAVKELQWLMSVCTTPLYMTAREIHFSINENCNKSHSANKKTFFVGFWSRDRWHQRGWSALKHIVHPPYASASAPFSTQSHTEVKRSTFQRMFLHIHAPVMDEQRRRLNKQEEQRGCLQRQDGRIYQRGLRLSQTPSFGPGFFQTPTLKELFDFWVVRCDGGRRLICTFLEFQMVPLSSLRQLSSTFPCHVRFSSNVYHIIEAKHNMIISFDDLARHISERSPNHFRSQRYIPFPFWGW